MPSTKLLLEDDYTSRVDGVYLEDILGEIDSESKLAHNIDLSHHHLPSTSIGGSGGGVHTIKIQAPADPPPPLGLSGSPLLVRHAAHPRDVRISKGENTVQQLAQFLAATGRRLRVLGKVICHFFRKGKLGLKLAIKIPFLVEIEASFETDWNRRE
ncbi:hypothetical protein ACC713_34515 [Rhizobium johnstonii]|uniref:hypothetical protein n=1 Tax=Rhizobium TaxID=379 RepID=UPI0013EF49F7|nr:hypothetical protein [Rhizobium leguminosarum]